MPKPEDELYEFLKINNYDKKEEFRKAMVIFQVSIKSELQRSLVSANREEQQKKFAKGVVDQLGIIEGSFKEISEGKRIVELCRQIKEQMKPYVEITDSNIQNPSKKTW